jgi:hypothetical protein
MEKITQKEIILKYLEHKDDWVPSYFLIKNDTPWGWIGSGSDRIARYMVEEGLLERKGEGKYSYYRIHKHGQLSML